MTGTRANAAVLYTKLQRRSSKRRRAVGGWFLIKYFVFILIFALTGLIYAKQKNTNVLLGYEAQKLKKELNLLRSEQLQLEWELLQIKSPRNLKRLMQEHNLTDLRDPEGEQIVRLGRPEPLSFSSTRTTEGALSRPFERKVTRLVKR